MESPAFTAILGESGFSADPLEHAPQLEPQQLFWSGADHAASPPPPSGHVTHSEARG